MQHLLIRYMMKKLQRHQKQFLQILYRSSPCAKEPCSLCNKSCCTGSNWTSGLLLRLPTQIRKDSPGSGIGRNSIHSSPWNPSARNQWISGTHHGPLALWFLLQSYLRHNLPLGTWLETVLTLLMSKSSCLGTLYWTYGHNSEMGCLYSQSL